MHFSSTEITALLGTWLWPLFRIGGMVMAAPVFGARSVPTRAKLIITLALTLIIAPLLPPVPAIDVFSPLSLLIIVQQVLIGVVMGFSVQLAFSAVITGGQVIAMQMGLGFSLMVDPQNGTQAPVLSQFYVLFAILIFLSLNGHLVLIHVLLDSFTLIPIGPDGLQLGEFRKLADWGGHIFAGGLSIALPAIASLLVVNIAFGIMTRAAPQMNIFAIGFPITMILGFALIWITLPGIMSSISSLFNDTYDLLRQLLGGL
ncbi:Flagellar biosynthesis protein FliR [hydrothermal vent metagenome]|uniref:Flagellar biosynthesis protein FliR n=1 Tax=hydrothermal vent metagenome TaxID=652676 RepID=A0A3B1BPK8_9ZZZZ